ncbi:Copine-4 [Porphyridium purpureum]|uniref:Copine-4 n=1 Tax=Porphyridium purpureum TaxID=35688 RepID=A0A5J4YZQ7_PORPP|nr:Copine-4 [Porphyridium purpureum]|eukprot:POR3580..scf208_2
MGNCFARDKDFQPAGHEQAASNPHAKNVPRAAPENGVPRPSSNVIVDDVQDTLDDMFVEGDLSSTLTLNFKCRALPNTDGVLSLTDAFVVVFMDGREVGRTEVVSNNLNPVFARSVQVRYRFEQQQHLQMKCYHVNGAVKSADAGNLDLQKQTYIGEANTEIATIVSEKGGKLLVPLMGPKTKGSSFIHVVAQELHGQNRYVSLQLAAEKLLRADFLGKSDPYFKIFRLNETDSGTEQILAVKSNVVRQNLNPVWKELDIKLGNLTGGDSQSPMYIEVWDWDPGVKQHDFLGSCNTSVDELVELQKQRKALPLMNTKRKGKDKSAGMLLVKKCEITTRPTFLDFVRGGTEINFQVAIDFTASNGDPRDINSLHYISPNAENPYQAAIRAIGTVLEKYDSDKKFPVYGFGAVLPWKRNEKSHCFAVNGNDAQPEVFGIHGVLQAYSNIIGQLRLSGPTLFAEIISTAASAAASRGTCQSSQAYDVLLILTDGEISDMKHTTDAIVGAADLGLSIIIVGVGNADFTKMEVLDGDDKRICSSTGKYASRDIVQFVPYNEFKRADGSLAEREFCGALLEEIPGQLLSFFASKGIKPNPPRSPTLTSVSSFRPPSGADIGFSSDPAFQLDQSTGNVNGVPLNATSNPSRGNSAREPGGAWYPTPDSVPVHPVRGYPSPAAADAHISSSVPGYPMPAVVDAHGTAPDPRYPGYRN